MKVTIHEKPKEQELKFPCLMISDNQQIILALSMRERGNSFYYEAITLDPGETYNKNGDYSEDYIACAFSPFHGSITLEND